MNDTPLSEIRIDPDAFYHHDGLLEMVRPTPESTVERVRREGGLRHRRIFTVGLDPDAVELFKDYYNEHNEDLFWMEGKLRGVWAKLEETPARLALTFRFMQWALGDDQDLPVSVDAETMARAIELTKWLRHEAERVLLQLTYGKPPAVEDPEVRKLLAWMERTGRQQVTPREAARINRWLASADAAEEVMRRAVQLQKGVMSTISTGGRPATVFSRI